ncbi:hypothetical protein [Telmatospirillum sp.]|uniref:hypothetical protein n=1 Tax=Telmatospirillum sp. TaxID=2079197 RepID=UPI002845DE02|nr:hypothetical protein [Telmatospirillum sp.]MDR3436278.1 hypothetical protein [Telmatospirillum sp.]
MKENDHWGGGIGNNDHNHKYFLLKVISFRTLRDAAVCGNVMLARNLSTIEED